MLCNLTPQEKTFIFTCFFAQSTLDTAISFYSSNLPDTRAKQENSKGINSNDGILHVMKPKTNVHAYFV